MGQFACKNMALSGQQRKGLQDALISAFPDKASLEQMLDHELDKNLDVIASGTNLREVVFKLIKKAEAQNWVKDLIDAAHKSNPGNLSLRAIAAFYINEEINLEERKNSRLNIPAFGPEASEVGADYTKLAKLLDAKNFKAANDETVEMMLWVCKREKEGYLRAQDIEKFPIKDLHTIDKLWLASSHDKFGFSVQKQIWMDVGGKPGEYDWETYLQFIEHVGWKEGDSIFKNLCWDLRADLGHLPILSSSTRFASDKMQFPQKMDSEMRHDFCRLLDVCEARLGILLTFVEELIAADASESSFEYETSASRLLFRMYPLPLLQRLCNESTTSNTPGGTVGCESTSNTLDFKLREVDWHWVPPKGFWMKIGYRNV